MPDIREAQFVAFYLFDVAETMDLRAHPRARRRPAVAGAPRAEARDAGLRAIRQAAALVRRRRWSASREVDGFQARFRVYDYGVISLALTRPFAGSWSDLVALGQTLDRERRPRAARRAAVRDASRPPAARARRAAATLF